jgi:hypothetical protein
MREPEIHMIPDDTHLLIGSLMFGNRIGKSPLGARKRRSGSQLVSVFLSPNERLAQSEGFLAIPPRQPPLHCPPR